MGTRNRAGHPQFDEDWGFDEMILERDLLMQQDPLGETEIDRLEDLEAQIRLEHEFQELVELKLENMEGRILERPLYQRRLKGRTDTDVFKSALYKQVRDPNDILDEIRLASVSEANGLDLHFRWADTNNGMRSMRLSNALRAKLRRGETIYIGKITLKGELL